MLAVINEYLYLQSNPDSGPGLEKRTEFPRERTLQPLHMNVQRFRGGLVREEDATTSFDSKLGSGRSPAIHIHFFGSRDQLRMYFRLLKLYVKDVVLI